MEVILALLGQRAMVNGATPVRCSIIPNYRGSIGSVTTNEGDTIPFSTELICRVSSLPAVGDEITINGIAGHVSVVRVQDSKGPWQRHGRIYITRRVDILGGDLDSTVTIYPSVSTTDAYGTTVRTPSATGVTMPARLDVTSTDESNSGGQGRTRNITMTVDADLSPYDAYSKLVCDGAEYQFEGDPIIKTDVTGHTWSRVHLRRYGAGQ